MKARIIFSCMTFLIMVCFLFPSISMGAYYSYYAHDFQWGSLGSNNGQFSYLSDIAMDSSGYVYVADTVNHRIQKFDSSGVYQIQWGVLGSGNGQFKYPSGIAIDSSGYVYVADRDNNRIQKFDSNGIYQTQWGILGSGNGQFNYPLGISVNGSEYVYVADTNNNRIQKFDSSGIYQTQWGILGSGNGQFNMPYGIAVDSSGYVYVADANNNRIQKFDSNGVYQIQWGVLGIDNGQLKHPCGIAVDSSGYVYVADTVNNRIQKFDSSGVYQAQGGEGYGSGKEQFNLPLGISVDGSGHVYVADAYNHRVQVFKNVTLSFPILYKAHGLNFSSYIDGQNPHIYPPPIISENQIRERMQIIAPYTEWVRSYGCTNGIQKSGLIAHELGLKVALSAWLKSDLAANEQEISNLIAAAKAGQADIVVVGTETLLRKNLTESQLIDYINRVKTELPGIPVTTNDVYSEFLSHPNVVSAIDLVLANYYPYWEGTKVDYAISNIHKLHKQVKAIAVGKEVIVGETGWPSDGNTVGEAVPTLANANYFFLNFVSWARANNVPYFYFTSLDESWKFDEGPQGIHWGIWDKFGNMKDGMQHVFEGDVLPDNWSCETLIGGPGTPSIEFTYVPPYGNSGKKLKGQVHHVKPIEYNVAVYIKVGGGWWTKPTFAAPLTVIQCDGSWSNHLTTYWSDSLATQITAYLVPVGYIPPPMSGGVTLPPELAQNAVASAIIDRNPSPITITDPGIVNAQQNASLLVNVDVLYDVANAKLLYKQGGKASWSDIPLSLQSGDLHNGVWNATIPSNQVTTRGLLCYIELTDVNGDIVRNNEQGIKVRGNIAINVKTTPPVSANVWNIIGPSIITDDKSIINNIGSGFGTAWIAWRWNPTLSHWEVPTTLGSNSVTADPFDAGTSWFYALDGDGSYVTKNVNGISVSANSSFSVPLKIGWNLICNPFDFPVAWSDSTIKIKYGAWEGTPTEAKDLVYVDNRAIWYNPDTRAYVTRYSNEATPYAMPKTRGQWLYSVVDGAYVVFPPIEYTGSPAPPLKPETDLCLWKVELALKSSEGNDIIEAIVDNKKQVSFSDIKPPSLPISTSNICFIRDNDELSSDRQGESNDMTWTISADTTESSLLEWKLICVPDDYKLTLEDETGKQINIRQVSNVVIDTGHRYILKALRIPLPNVTRLLTNYPNPFNPETWIPYELSDASAVIIKIYTSEGNLVRTLSLGRKEAGYYITKDKSAYWDGKNEYGESVSSGIYFYTIYVGNFTTTRKMTLMK